LERLLDLALAHHPELHVARAQAEAARGRLLQAGLYPNPTVGWQGEQIGDRNGRAGQQGPFVAQEIVTGGKLRLDQAAAGSGVTAAEWQALTHWSNVVTRVRAAYYEVLTAQREVQENEAVVRLAQENWEVTQKLHVVGRGTLPDVLRARVELEESRNRLVAACRRAEGAGQLLAAAAGLPELPAGPLEGRLELGPPAYELPALKAAVLARSSEVLHAQATLGQAEYQRRRAYAENLPNLEVRVRPIYDFAQDNGQLFLETGVKLPLFNRNQGRIFAAEAEVARAAAEVRQVQLRLTERLIAAFQRYQTARQQVANYEQRILPDARESLRLVRAAFERGDAKFDYTALLVAQRTLAQGRLAYVQTLGELWRAVSEIEGLLQSGIAVCPEPGGLTAVD
jgi:cobalt-zinc-cadmium efflux system outer membrane protein